MVSNAFLWSLLILDCLCLRFFVDFPWLQMLSLHQTRSSMDDQMDCHCWMDLWIFLQTYESFFSHHYQTSSTLHVCLNDKCLLLFVPFFWQLNTLSWNGKEYLAVTGLWRNHLALAFPFCVSPFNPHVLANVYSLIEVICCFFVVSFKKSGNILKYNQFVANISEIFVQFSNKTQACFNGGKTRKRKSSLQLDCRRGRYSVLQCLVTEYQDRNIIFIAPPFEVDRTFHALSTMFLKGYPFKRVFFGSKDCTKELKLECAYFRGWGWMLGTPCQYFPARICCALLTLILTFNIVIYNYTKL